MDKVMFTVAQFCERNGISRSFYFKLRAQGKGPRVARIGKAVRISFEAEAEWRQRFEGQYASPADLERLLRESVAILLGQRRIIRWLASKNAPGTGSPQ
jgi:hypothetical protein